MRGDSVCLCWGRVGEFIVVFFEFNEFGVLVLTFIVFIVFCRFFRKFRCGEFNVGRCLSFIFVLVCFFGLYLILFLVVFLVFVGFRRILVVIFVVCGCFLRVF